MGVLGVLAKFRLGGGVMSLSSTSLEGTGKDEMRVFIGLSNGRRLSGGNRRGCRLFLLIGGNALGFSVAMAEFIVNSRRCLVLSEDGVEGSSTDLLEGGGKAPSLSTLLTTGVLRFAKKGISICSFGDS